MCKFPEPSSLNIVTNSDVADTDARCGGSNWNINTYIVMVGIDFFFWFVYYDIYLFIV